MKKYIITHLVNVIMFSALFIGNVSCSGDVRHGIKRIILDSDLQYNFENSSYIVGNPLSLVESNGFIYVSNNSDKLILKTDLDFKSESLFIKRGNAPGEVNFIYRFYVADDTLFIGNTNARSLYKYNSDGEFISELDINTVIGAPSNYVIDNTRWRN